MDQEELTKILKELINLSSDMRILLEKCRNERIPLSLAKEIDFILEKAKDFD
jgi:hypothetical protein